MNLHSGARTCPASRGLLVQRVRELGWTVTRSAEAAGISRRTAHKWLRRYEPERPASLQDRSSRPRRVSGTPIEWREMILLLRRTRMTGPQIARGLKRPRATVARVLKRAGLERLKNLEPKAPEHRYQHRRPGDLLHLDVKKLGRIAGYYGHRITGSRLGQRKGRVGWEYVHVAIDDCTRVAYAEVLRDELGTTSAAFLQRALVWYRSLGIRVRRILTDNGSGYIGRRFAHAAARLRVVHKRTRPYRPQTNGKAERFIQTLLREWAYAVPYLTSKARTRVLPRWLRYYNRKRPHGSLDGQPPFRRLRPRL